MCSSPRRSGEGPVSRCEGRSDLRERGRRCQYSRRSQQVRAAGPCPWPARVPEQHPAPPLVTGPVSETDLAVQMSANDMDMESDGWSSENSSKNSTPLPPLPEMAEVEASEEAVHGPQSQAESFTASRSPWVEGKRDRSFRRQSPDRNTNALMPAWPGVEAAGFASGRASAGEGAGSVFGSADPRDGLEAPARRPAGAASVLGAPSAFGAGEPTRSFRSRGSAQRSAVLTALRDLPDQNSGRSTRDSPPPRERTPPPAERSPPPQRAAASPSNTQPLDGELLDVAGLSLQEGP